MLFDFGSIADCLTTCWRKNGQGKAREHMASDLSCLGPRPGELGLKTEQSMDTFRCSEMKITIYCYKVDNSICASLLKLMMADAGVGNGTLG